MKWLFIFMLFIAPKAIYSQGLIQDESYLDPDFIKFRLKLSNCIEARDTSLLKELLADTVSTDHYTCNIGAALCTKDEVIRHYFTEGDDGWKQLEALNRFGFKRSVPINGRAFFYAPSYSVFSDTQLIILGENVNIRSQPGLNSNVIASASYEIFSCNCNINDMTDSTYLTKDGIDWVEIKLIDGQKGYVNHALTSDVIYKDLTVVKQGKKWKIVGFYNDPGC